MSAVKTEKAYNFCDKVPVRRNFSTSPYSFQVLTCVSVRRKVLCFFFVCKNEEVRKQSTMTLPELGHLDLVLFSARKFPGRRIPHSQNYRMFTVTSHFSLDMTRAERMALLSGGKWLPGRTLVVIGTRNSCDDSK